ncbi:MAG TPA: HAD-IIIA family hydrolase [Candidatus Omnitrophota bacterium]|nr:HAD-IIIA family hydrolase [Candidatus Omnitrophota bacterium]HRZ15606.1 HAD-IIIA family hydrolase [Candidatus Omnitrophota bacterium]
MAIPASVMDKARRIKVLLLDVDGVLTDGRIIYDSRGRDSKFFDVHDGMSVYLLKKAGIPTILVTAKGSGAIRPRARDMRIDIVFENVARKSSVLEKVLPKYHVTADQLCFVGDDLVDIGLMHKVGMPVAVANACEEIKQAACYVTARPGGRGAVREVGEMILKAQGVWDALVKEYDV